MHTQSIFARVLLGAALALALFAPRASAQGALSSDRIQSIHSRVIAQDAAIPVLGHAQLRRLLDPHVSRRGLRRIELGRSAEGSRLSGYTAGNGPLRVLLWSQADGTAPVGTLVIADLLRFVVSDDDEGFSRLLRDSLTIIALPMVNPDGAAVASPRNAHGVEVLLDGRRRTTPEARALTRLAESAPGPLAIGLEAAESRASDIGPISLHVPAAAATGVEDSSRIEAARLAGAIASAITSQGRQVERIEMPGDPRRLPDFLQNAFRGVVVVGFPSAEAPMDQARELGFSALLAALHATAIGSVPRDGGELFSSVPVTRPTVAETEADLLIREARLRVPGLPSIVADVAVEYGDPARKTGARLVAIGDLSVVAQDTLAVSGLEVNAGRDGLTQGEGGAYRLTVGSEVDFDLRRRTRTVLRTLYTVRDGRLSQPPDHRFPHRARWFVSLQPPLLTQERSHHQKDAEAALEEVGWAGSAEGAGGSSRTFGAWRVGVGRSITNTLGVEVVAGGSDRWSQSRMALDGSFFRLEQDAQYAGVLLSYEHRHLRIAAGPAAASHRFAWAEVVIGGDRASGRALRPGLIWEAVAALPGGTRFAPELRVQQRSFTDASIDGFGIVPAFPVRSHTFSIGLATTFRRWEAR